jgi:hypothetical protein
MSKFLPIRLHTRDLLSGALDRLCVHDRRGMVLANPASTAVHAPMIPRNTENTKTAPEHPARPLWRKPVYAAHSINQFTQTRTCGTGSDSFPGWCASS